MRATHLEIKIHCKFDELVDPKKLNNHPKNRNKHGQEQIERLAELYKGHGIRHPIIISNQTGCIVAGHGRKLAAIRAGIKNMPVVYQDFENADLEYAFIQSDNAIALWAELDLSAINFDLQDLGPDFNLDLLGIQGFTLDMVEKEGLIADDETPEPTESIAKLGDIFKLGSHRLMCGDSTSIEEVDSLMDGEKADMVFTDPPYGINAISSSGVLSARYEQYAGEENDQCALDFINLCIAREEKIIAFGGNYFAHALPKSTHWIIWDKRGAEMEGGNKNGDQSDCEIAWTNLPKKNVKIYKHVWAGWFRAGPKKEELNTKVHPSQKPVGLFEKIFEDYDFKSCFDGFGGSGSTLIACEKTKRKCFMMELDPHYCDVIIARWENFTGQKAELLNGK